MNLARTVRGDDDDRRRLGAHGPDFGDRDLEIRKDLEKIGLKRFIGPVELVDQEHGRTVG